MRIFVGLAFAVIFAMACEDSETGESNIDSVTGYDHGESNIDMTEYYDDIGAHCTGVFEGHVSDDPYAKSDTTFLPCSIKGQSYRLVVQAEKEMRCNGSEDEQDVDCTYAVSAYRQLSGTLTAGEDLEYSVNGYGRVQNSWNQENPSLECSIIPETNEFPHQVFEFVSHVWLPSDPEAEFFVWQRRLSEDDAVETKWEVCRFTVENRL